MAVEPKTGEPAIHAFPFGIAQRYLEARMIRKEVCPLLVMHRSCGQKLVCVR